MKMSKKEKQETKTGKKKIKTWQIVTAVFAVILLALLVNIVKQSMGAAAAGTPVTTVQVLKGDITQTVDTSGSVESEESKTYFAQVGATIGELHVKAGDSVKTGDLLLSYDTADLEQALKQTELEASVAKEEALQKQYKARLRSQWHLWIMHSRRQHRHRQIMMIL